MKKEPCVYIMGSKKDGVLYIGVTSDLLRRVYQHKTKTGSIFVNRYHVSKLVYFEFLENMYDAITREKQLKKWKREWKIELIEANNPTWKDLGEELLSL
jgi:putative endonuclease